jgi:flagellar capping protein FliD
MEKLLYKIYDNVYPKYTSYKFSSMLNIGLVITGYKKGALEKIDDKLKTELTKIGLYIDS